MKKELVISLILISVVNAATIELPKQVQTYYDVLNFIYLNASDNELLKLKIGENISDQNRNEYFNYLINNVGKMIKFIEIGRDNRNIENKMMYSCIQGYYKIDNVQTKKNELEIKINIYEILETERIQNISTFKGKEDYKEYMNKINKMEKLEKLSTTIHKWIYENKEWKKVQGELVELKDK